MSETNTQNPNIGSEKQYRVYRGFSIVWLKTLRLMNLVLNFFSLKQPTQFWGIVYDSVSKQPLDPVIVKLMYVDGREVETCVTDMAGRYGFLARPGKFKIYVRKTNYLFPSRLVAGDSDGIYVNLYHGEFFTCYQDYEVVAPNIPMDPAATDWNQTAKLAVINNSPYLKYLLKILVAIIFWFGFILEAIFIFKTFPHIPIIFYIIAGVYLLLLGFSTVMPDARLWGKVKTNIVLAQGESLYLELRDRNLSGICFGKAKVKDDGKFLLRSNKGDYSLFVSKIIKGGTAQFLGSTKVRIGGEGVFNGTILVSFLKP